MVKLVKQSSKTTARLLQTGPYAYSRAGNGMRSSSALLERGCTCSFSGFILIIALHQLLVVVAIHTHRPGQVSQAAATRLDAQLVSRDSRFGIELESNKGRQAGCLCCAVHKNTRGGELALAVIIAHTKAMPDASNLHWLRYERNTPV